VNVNPSAFAFVNWNVKLFVNDWMLTGVVQKALPASFEPPSVNRKREAVWFQLAEPFNCIPVIDVNPPPKLTAVVPEPELTVSVKVALPVPLAFFALSVTDDVPDAVGVPEINPLLVFTVSPAGNPVAP
jgi:hypothetical protein